MSTPCFNIMSVVGAPAELAQLREQVRGQYSDGRECLFDFTTVLPDPEPAPQSWYYDNWGTERFATYCEIEEDGSGGEFRMRFETASSEPKGVVAALSASYEELRFELVHNTPDWDLGGRWVFSAGEVVEEDWWSDEGHNDDDDEADLDTAVTVTDEPDVPRLKGRPLQPRGRPSVLSDRARRSR
jgi:hypothetical protein